MQNKVFSNYKERFESVFSRFPMAVIFSFIAFVSVVYVQDLFEWDTGFTKRTFFALLYPLSALLLSVALHLSTEDLPNKRKSILVQGATHLLWLALCVYWSFAYPLTVGQSVACGAFVFAMFVACFTLSFVREQTDMSAIHFMLKFCFSLLVSAFLAFCLFLGLLLLAYSVNLLFNINDSETVYISIFAFSFVLIAPLLLLSQLPKYPEKYNHHDWLSHKFGNGVIHFLLVPLTFAYVLTLYIYGGKILMTWQLPNGGVSLLVSVLMLCMVILMILLYPVLLKADAKPFDKLLIRYLPLAVLPLLVLMSVAIGRRIADYGVTIQRLYLLLFNVWCYVVCVVLLLQRCKRVMWIATSFVAVLCVVSCFSLNISWFAKRQLTADVRQLFEKHGVRELPVSAKQYEKLLASMSYTDASAVMSKIDYLQNNYKKNSGFGLIAPEAVAVNYDIERKPVSDTASDTGQVSVSKEIDYNIKSNKTVFRLPQGYKKGYLILSDSQLKAWKVNDDEIAFRVEYGEEDRTKSIDFQVSFERLSKQLAANSQAVIMLRNDYAQLILTELNINCGKETVTVWCKGMLFVK